MDTKINHFLNLALQCIPLNYTNVEPKFKMIFMSFTKNVSTNILYLCLQFLFILNCFGLEFRKELILFFIINAVFSLPQNYASNRFS